MLSRVSHFLLNIVKNLTLLTSPMRGRGYSTHSVCLCVCYRSSGRHAYSTGPTKVPKESARHKDQNKCRDRAKTSLFKSYDSL